MDTSNNDGIIITHEFDAPVATIWKYWTDEDMVKKWWGPKEFTAPSIKIDLRVGGKYIFAMQGPKGSQWDKVMYSAGVYKEIVPNQKLVVTDYFSDENGTMLEPKDFGQDTNFPKESTVTVLFESLGPNKSKLTIIYPKPESDAEFQAILKSGMVEGWNSSLDKLSENVV